MHIYIYIYLYIYTHIPLSLYIYTYIHIDRYIYILYLDMQNVTRFFINTPPCFRVVSSTAIKTLNPTVD